MTHLESSQTNQKSERLYLYPDEVEKLLKSFKGGEDALRDRLAIMLMFYHGLRVSELINLQWSDVNFQTASIFIHRAKGSNDSTHSIPGDELRLLRKVKSNSVSQYIIYNKKRASLPVTRDAINKLISRKCKTLNFDIKIHPHMFRHSCGYYLANKGVPIREIQDYLGHKNINHTVHYTRLNPNKSRHYF